jgi:hypothetical protein
MIDLAVITAALAQQRVSAQFARAARSGTPK